MDEKLFHVGVKAILQRNDGKMLVMKTGPFKNDEAHWDLPGGRIQENQTELETLAREIEEETGITEYSEPVYFGSCISNIQIPVNDFTVGLVLVAYLVQVEGDVSVKLSDEHSEIEWVDRAQAAQMLSYKYPKNFTDLLK